MEVTISVKTAIECGMLLVDARSQNDYDRGHIPDAVSLPLKVILADESPDAVAQEAVKVGIRNDTKIVVYDDASGAVASRVAWTLEHAGLDRAWLLDVTYKDWTESGGKSSVEPVETKPANFVPRQNNGIRATINDVESSNGGVILLDNRERLNFLETHIPGATNVPYHMLADGKRVLKNPEDLKRIFANRGIDEKSKIITYCGSAGTLSGLAFYALRHAGLNDPQLYSKSLREWKGENKPTETQPDAAYWDLSAE